MKFQVKGLIQKTVCFDSTFPECKCAGELSPQQPGLGTDWQKHSVVTQIWSLHKYVGHRSLISATSVSKSFCIQLGRLKNYIFIYLYLNLAWMRSDSAG